MCYNEERRRGRSESNVYGLRLLTRGINQGSIEPIQVNIGSASCFGSEKSNKLSSDPLLDIFTKVIFNCFIKAQENDADCFMVPPGIGCMAEDEEGIESKERVWLRTVSLVLAVILFYKASDELFSRSSKNAPTKICIIVDYRDENLFQFIHEAFDAPVQCLNNLKTSNVKGV